MKVQKTAEVPQAQFIDKVVDIPVDMQRQVPAVQSCAENSGGPAVAAH